MRLSTKSWISQQSLVILLILLQGYACLEILQPGEESYDALDSSSGYKADFRILKQQTSESVELVTVDSLSVTYVLQAKYVYDNDEVNAHQEYVFSSWSNHLFLTETLQRLPSTNKTLIQLYKNATLIGYDIRLSLGQKPNSSSDDYEFAIIYYREDDIDTLVDGTLTRFTNMLAGDTEWRKITFELETTQAMIFTVENGYETEIFMYSAGPGNITQAQQLSPQLVSRYIFTNAKGDQTIFLLLRRAYSTTIANAPDIIDFSLSIFAIFTNSKAASTTPANSSTGYNWDSKVTGQYASGSNSTLTSDSYTLSLFRHPFAKFDVLLPIFNIQQLLSSRVTLASSALLAANPPQGKMLLGEQLSRILAYEVIVPIANHTNAYFLGATATSCNALFKYSVNTAADPLSGDLGLTQDDYNGNFSDKFSNIDSTSTIKTIIQPSAYAKCAPTCVVHAVLYIEILVDPSSDMTTFKLQGTQLLHDLSNPIKPFFDQLPLLAYTFFEVKLESDLNQLAIQYFSGYDLCYLQFKHSFIQTEDEEAANVSFSNLLESKLLPRGLQQAQTTTTTTADYWPTFTNIQSVNSQNLYSSGQMIVKPAKKGLHIFSALNLSPIYSSFTVQANSQVLRQLTNSSYIAVSLNGESDMQSLYYDKLYNNDRHISLQFCSILSNVSLFALSCNSTMNVKTCQIPQESNYTYFTSIKSNQTNIPDLCPNTTCHILISLQYTVSSTSTAATNSLNSKADESSTLLLSDASSDSSSTQVIKFSISLHEIEATSKTAPTTSSSSSTDGNVKQTAGGSSTQQSPSDEKNSNSSRSFWIIISCCVLLVGIVIVSAVTCYLKRKENKLLNEMQLSKLSEKEDNRILDHEEDDDDYNDANEDFSNKRTTTHSTEQNNLPDQIDS